MKVKMLIFTALASAFSVISFNLIRPFLVGGESVTIPLNGDGIVPGPTIQQNKVSQNITSTPIPTNTPMAEPTQAVETQENPKQCRTVCQQICE